MRHKRLKHGMSASTRSTTKSSSPSQQSRQETAERPNRKQRSAASPAVDEPARADDIERSTAEGLQRRILEMEIELQDERRKRFRAEEKLREHEALEGVVRMLTGEVHRLREDMSKLTEKRSIEEDAE